MYRRVHQKTDKDDHCDEYALCLKKRPTFDLL